MILICLHKLFQSMRYNIVEWSTRLTNAEFKRFLVIANRSALEVVGCLYLAKRRSYISDEKFSELYSKIETLVKMIQALINTLND
jgi:four helix bundle protein